MYELTPDCDQAFVDQYFDQELEKARLILPRWDGGTVLLWEYDRELFRLTLRIEKSGTPGNLTITCDTPLEMSGPFNWSDSEIRVTRDRESFIVSDAKAEFTLRAAVVEVEENCEPLNAIFKG